MFLDAPDLKVTYQPIIEVRQRLERRLDRDFSESAADNRTDLLSRYRLGFGVKYRQWKGMFVAQWADDEAWTTAGTSMTERRDMILAWISHPVSNGDLTLGRQRIRKGSERLVTEAGWNNVSNAFDGFRWQNKRVDFFAAKAGVLGNPSHNAEIGGASYTSKFGETMYLFKHDNQNDVESDLHTLDQIYRGKLGQLTYDFEAAGQLGHRNSAKVEAWAMATKLDYKSTKKLSFFANGYLASGGGDANTYRTFDSHYAQGHGVFGLLDIQGWRNTQTFGVGARYKARKDIEVSGEYYRYALRDASDAWWGNSNINRRAGGRFVDPTGKSGRDVGSELAMEVKWEARKDLSVQAAFGIFHPGRFIENLTNDTTDHKFGYVQVSYKF